MTEGDDAPDRPRVVLTHAYSVSNAGDGWLVGLALDLVREAVPGAHVTVIAVDGTELQGADEVITFGGRTRDLRGAVRTAVSAFRSAPAVELRAIDEADLVVAVGGGYLRGRRPRELVVMGLVHGTQLRAGARRSGPTVYLPQSIGPVPGPVAWLLRRWLDQIDVVHARDDPTMEFLRGHRNVVRTPDVAALHAADAEPRGVRVRADGRPRVLFQVRPLPARSTWPADVGHFAVASKLDLVTAVQSLAGRRNDDLALTRTVAPPGDVPTVAQVLAAPGDLHAAICGRLHAAVACIAAGVPAVHVGYERKSLGVFTDLGLERYVVEPSAAGLARAERLAVDLAEDPSPYWAGLDGQRGHLRRHHADLVREVAERCSAARPT